MNKIKKAIKEDCLEDLEKDGELVKLIEPKILLKAVAEEIEDFFKKNRFSKHNHQELGDIRLTIGQQEEIINLIKESIK